VHAGIAIHGPVEPDEGLSMAGGRPGAGRSATGGGAGGSGGAAGNGSNLIIGRLIAGVCATVSWLFMD
jgi:hypothetical protein